MKKSIALLLILCFIVSPFLVIPQADAAGLYTVMGTVVDRRGSPVAGAKVDLINDETYGINWHIVGTTTSDANGNYKFKDVPSGSPNFKILLTFTDGSRTYKTGEQDSQWTDGSQTLVEIPTKWTTLYNYPPPEYGYLWGIVVAEGTNSRPMSNAAVYVISNEQRYYSFSNNLGGYEMILPVGHYRVYAQYQDGGFIYQSRQIEVDIIGSDFKEGSNPLTISVPLSAPASNPLPPEIPGSFTNTVNGTVAYADGKGVSGAAVSLWQATDDGTGNFVKKADTTADSNGLYRFDNVRVTSDKDKEVYGMKTFRVSATYTDPQGTVRTENKSFPLYNPNVILGIGGTEQSARNMSANIQFGYSTMGWVQIQSNPTGAKVYVDGQPWKDADGNQLITPCTAYIEPGRHTITLKANGFSDRNQAVDMVENTQTTTVILQLEKPVVPGWVVPAVAVLIILVVVGLILAIVASKRHMFMGPLSGVFAPIGKSVGSFRASSAARKAERETLKAHAAEARKAEKARQAQMADASLAARPKIDRRREQDAFNAPSEKPLLPEHKGDDLSMVSAREIYRKSENPGIERIPHAQATGSTAKSPFGGRDMPQREPVHRESQITAEPDGRIRVPRSMPVARDEPVSSLRDKERVIRYVREHADGVSFIQMSNELEIQPNKLTIITKELVINDDIEKIKGLYFYKTHDTSPDEGKSSVVVWRLDGED